MRAQNALNTMVAHSGLGKDEISVRIGRNASFLRKTISKGSVPRVDTLARIADACGYDLALIKRDAIDTIYIDPPRE